MRYAPRKVFILEDKMYIEVNYEYYRRIKEENPKRRFWMFGGMLMEVVEDDYVKLNREKSRMQYLYKLEKEFSTLSYDSINEDEDHGAIILKTSELSVCEVVEMRMMAERLHEVLKVLTDEEKQLIQALYYDSLSERAYARMQGVSQVTIHKRKYRVLQKLRRMI